MKLHLLKNVVRLRNEYIADSPAEYVYLHIANITETASVTGIYYLLFHKVTEFNGW